MVSGSGNSEALASWFVEAKQALAISGPICTEANTIITTSRKKIENATALWGQVGFMHQAIDKQFSILEDTRRLLMELQKTSGLEYQQSLSEIKRLDANLNSALSVLEKTKLDPAFQANSKDGSKNGSPKIGSKGSITLRSFVHENGIEALGTALSNCSDKVQSLNHQISTNIANIELDIAGLKRRMFSINNLKRQDLVRAHENTDQIAEHAHTMAELLESLTRHYDLCFEAVELEKSDNQNDDFKELMRVLESDTLEVEGAVEELYDRRKSIETNELAVEEFHKTISKVHSTVLSFFDEFEIFGSTKLATYSTLLQKFSKDHKEAIREFSKLIQEKSSLVDYYNLFLKSYHALILEVSRRKKADERLKAIADEMRRTLLKAYKEEMIKRQEFIKQRGDYLPIDLWEGLTEFPVEPRIILGHTSLPTVKNESLANAVNQSI